MTGDGGPAGEAGDGSMGTVPPVMAGAATGGTRLGFDAGPPGSVAGAGVAFDAGRHASKAAWPAQAAAAPTTAASTRLRRLTGCCSACGLEERIVTTRSLRSSAAGPGRRGPGRQPL